jgi:transcriptional regulator with XRE-family HTH domain
VHRLAKGLTQGELAKVIGVTFQQVQKYENGRNRVSAGRLARIAEALDVPLHTLFAEAKQRMPNGPMPIDDMQVEGAERLLRAFRRIKDRRARTALIALARSLG